jgi:hypothetical protein
MRSRTVTLDGQTWGASPSGFVTQYDHDEFAILFVRGTGDDREIRVTRYSPMGTRSREASFAELDDARLLDLFRQSQPSFTSPEAGYAPAPERRSV